MVVNEAKNKPVYRDSPKAEKLFGFNYDAGFNVYNGLVDRCKRDSPLPKNSCSWRGIRLRLPLPVANISQAQQPANTTQSQVSAMGNFLGETQEKTLIILCGRRRLRRQQWWWEGGGGGSGAMAKAAREAAARRRQRRCHGSCLMSAEGSTTAKTAREAAAMRSRINYSSQFYQKMGQKNTRDTPLIKKIIIISTPQYWSYLQHGLFHLNPGIRGDRMQDNAPRKQDQHHRWLIVV